MYNLPLRILVGLDQLLNIITGGDEDDTLSSRIYVNSISSPRWMKCRKVVDWLFSFEPDHCKVAFQVEYKKKVLWLNKYQDLIKDL